ncbi:hypothetical protein DDZ13_01400 [Coraliomargarita sinensis]|uniref:Glycosyltransferase RgtA/B/C/D-like domain-containing protein n=2 Tax=Coraliomargarita sinensis TaxID=2174842 RepID=A0A317ZIZ2_9BACT|nr:hypothetical protein DDZ13_01400 [Coraliomargarita sinensis]
MSGKNTSPKSSRNLFLSKKGFVAMASGFVIFYLVCFLFNFLADPLGQAPVLDARENLAWAEKISKSELPEEPLYRALFYPWILSWVPQAEVFAPALGVLCHLLNALLCGLIARQVWRSSAAGFFSGAFYGIYPVALFFAVQVLDITFALSFFLLAIYCLLRFAESPRWFLPLFAGLMLSIAFLARPNFLPAALACPLVVFGLSCRCQKGIATAVGLALLAATPLGLSFLAQGLVNKQLSGEFRILPWQGAYNLYAANREGANGKFYKQRLAFDDVPEGMNPTRMESVYLYREETGDASPSPDIDDMNAFWRQRLFQHIAANPFDWLQLMVRKVTYLVNDWEQYNNLSYHYHKERWPLLAWNPLGWGLLLIGSAVALSFGWRKMEKAESASLALLALAYTAGVLLFFVSARFRLPLAPILVVLCGGLATISWRRVRLKRGLLVGAGALIVAGFTYGNWFDARSRETFRQDQLLLAKAALESGQDEASLDWAEEALTADPDLDAAKRVRLAALFNLWLSREGEAAARSWKDLKSALAGLRQNDATTLFIRGVAFWREGQPEDAKATWRAAVDRYGPNAGSSAGALEWATVQPQEKLSPLARQIGEVLER